MKIKRLFCFIKNRLMGKGFLVPEFKNEYWRNIKLRRFYVNDIIENSSLIGKTKSEIEASFGKNESKHYYENRWTYFVQNREKKKYVLALYFEGDVLVRIKYEYRYTN